MIKDSKRLIEYMVKHVLSLGAGVQSSTLALMANKGLIKHDGRIAVPDLAVFADTQNEPEHVYEWLEYLKTQLSFPVYVVSKGNLGEDSCTIKTSKSGNTYTDNQVPMFTHGRGRMQRRCTGNYKIDPICGFIYRHLRPKYKIGQGGERVYQTKIYQWLGISTDEAHRQKDSKRNYITNYYPLIEAGMSRRDCLDWMKSEGFPQPPRSACVFCPYHSDADWLDLKLNYPKEFEKAVLFEREVQKIDEKETFLHRRLIPLDQVKFVPGKGDKQFGEECEGMCGV